MFLFTGAVYNVRGGFGDGGARAAAAAPAAAGAARAALAAHPPHEERGEPRARVAGAVALLAAGRRGRGRLLEPRGRGAQHAVHLAAAGAGLLVTGHSCFHAITTIYDTRRGDDS